MKKRFLVSLGLLGLTLLAYPAGAVSLDFALGKALFDRPWTSAPASTQATDGLGPLFNARSCVACHENNGRGDYTVDKYGYLSGTGYVVRIGNAKGEGDPVYGKQFQTNAVQGHQIEGDALWQNGRIQLTNLAYGPLASDSRHGARLSQPLFGLGLLEQVSDETLLALADPEDLDQDGISGRVNILRYEEGKPVIGRFSWKATAATLKEQAANAFANDIGMSTPLRLAHAGDCTAHQPDCLAGPHGDSPQYENLEISTEMLDLMTRYLQGIQAPLNTRPHDPKGQHLFKSTGCADCHKPSLPNKFGGTVQAYTDLLLHDMGDALADGIREFDASGREWRTQPLWGTRLAVERGQRFLHDGRAETVEEAISFHDGEAFQSRLNFEKLTADERQTLLDFVNGL